MKNEWRDAKLQKEFIRGSLHGDRSSGLLSRGCFGSNHHKTRCKSIVKIDGTQNASMNFWIFACARSFSSGPSTSPILSWYSYNTKESLVVEKGKTSLNIRRIPSDLHFDKRRWKGVTRWHYLLFDNYDPTLNSRSIYTRYAAKMWYFTFSHQNLKKRSFFHPTWNVIKYTQLFELT